MQGYHINLTHTVVHAFDTNAIRRIFSTLLSVYNNSNATMFIISLFPTLYILQGAQLN